MSDVHDPRQRLDELCAAGIATRVARILAHVPDPRRRVVRGRQKAGGEALSPPAPEPNADPPSPVLAA